MSRRSGSSRGRACARHRRFKAPPPNRPFMKRPRGGGRNTGHPTPFQPTTTAATTARLAALSKECRGRPRLAMASVAVWCAAASSSASAAAGGGVRRGAYHASGAFLHGFPLGMRCGIGRGVRSTSATGAWHNKRVVEPGGCCGAFFAGAATAAEAPGSRESTRPWRPSSTVPSQSGVIMSAVFSQNSSLRGSGTLSGSTSTSTSGSRAFFGSGSSSRTAARKRRERRQVTRATKREEGLRMRCAR